MDTPTPTLPPPHTLEGDERIDALCPGRWVVQRARGHRATTDDQLLAWAALRAVEGGAMGEGGGRARPLRVLDLGAGKGVVTLWLSARWERAIFVGLEAFAPSHALSLKGRALNGLEGRFEPLLGDLRDPAAWEAARGAARELSRREGVATEGERAAVGGQEEGVEGRARGEGFDIICGAPPFMPLGAGVMPADPQRAAGRFELRGGVEGYLTAAAALLAPEGRALILMDGLGEGRLLSAAPQAGLTPLSLTRVRPRPSAPPTYALATLARAPRERAEPPLYELSMRGEEGEGWSAEYEAARRLLGLPAAP
jgi:tRNA1(Val) A37 N6-methylase TrmN6